MVNPSGQYITEQVMKIIITLLFVFSVLNCTVKGVADEKVSHYAFPDSRRTTPLPLQIDHPELGQEERRRRSLPVRRSAV